MQITCDDNAALKIIKNDIELTPSLRTSKGTDKATACNPQSINSSMEMYINSLYLHFSVFWIQQIWSNPVFICISITDEIHFAKPLKMSETCAVPDERWGIKTVLSNS